jgi:uncharacterized membrane protein YjfL (UPF0719 family)
MDRNALRAVITGFLLVPLAWVVIAVAVKQSTNLPVILIWGAVFVVDLAMAVYSVLHWRRRVAGSRNG